jgi:adenosylcobinamide kinase/adenosylcobinamide-phosphate guanylyltransferase
MIYFITGGTRSGKSSYAQKAALQLNDRPIYIATSKVTSNDKEFTQRVERHKSDRDGRWTTYEAPLYVSKLPLIGNVIVLDCVTLWLTNFFSLHKMDAELSLESIRKEIDALQNIAATFFIVSNEIGMGIHPDTLIGRKFTDLQGFANQYIASKASKVILMISGIPVIIKDEKHAV